MQEMGPTASIGKDVLVHFQASGESLLDGSRNCGFRGERLQKVTNRRMINVSMNSCVK